MTTVRIQKGETLGAIAKRYHTTVDKLAKANGIKDPNKVSVGQSLKIPDGFDSKPASKPTPSKPSKPSTGGAKAPDTFESKPTKPTTSTQAPAPTQPAASGKVDMQKLGKLSAKYESNGNPGTVSSGVGDAGGVSYGSYQFATKTGSAKAFVDSLSKTHPEYAKAFKGLTPGTAAFSKAWKDLAAKDPKGFGQAQHDYIASKYYEPAKASVDSIKGLDMSKRSQTLNDVLWSTAVQHGPGGAAEIFKTALKGKDVSKMSDADIAKAIYAERGRTNANGTLVHFSKNSPAVQKSVAARFKSELKDALAELGAK